jgi:hypothetical protein
MVVYWVLIKFGFCVVFLDDVVLFGGKDGISKDVICVNVFGLWYQVGCLI